jgi:hypothetical protein
VGKDLLRDANHLMAIDFANVNVLYVFCRHPTHSLSFSDPGCSFSLLSLYFCPFSDILSVFCVADITDSMEEQWEDLGEEDKRKQPKMDHDVIMEVAHNLTGKPSFTISLSHTLTHTPLFSADINHSGLLSDSPSDFSADIASVESEIANVSSLLRDFESTKAFVQLDEHGD